MTMLQSWEAAPEACRRRTKPGVKEGVLQTGRSCGCLASLSPFPLTVVGAALTLLKWNLLPWLRLNIEEDTLV